MAKYFTTDINKHIDVPSATVGNGVAISSNNATKQEEPKKKKKKPETADKADTQGEQGYNNNGAYDGADWGSG